MGGTWKEEPTILDPVRSGTFLGPARLRQSPPLLFRRTPDPIPLPPPPPHRAGTADAVTSFANLTTKHSAVSRITSLQHLWNETLMDRHGWSSPGTQYPQSGFAPYPFCTYLGLALRISVENDD